MSLIQNLRNQWEHHRLRAEQDRLNGRRGLGPRLLVVAAILFLFGLFLNFKEQTELTSVTKGIVQRGWVEKEVNLHRQGGRPVRDVSFVAHFSLTYTVSGERYSAVRRIGGYGLKMDADQFVLEHPPGTAFDVFYDPDNPSAFKFENGPVIYR